MRLFAILITVIFIFPIFLGCKKEISPGRSAKPAVTKTQKIETKPETLVQGLPNKGEEYVYEPKGRRDPFTPLVEITKKEAGKRGVSSTLESYDISEFRLAAIAEKDKQRYALLVTSDNKSYTVKEGTILGLYRGRVKEITPNKVILLEYTKDYKGELKPRQIVLELRRDEVEE